MARSNYTLPAAILAAILVSGAAKAEEKPQLESLIRTECKGAHEKRKSLTCGPLEQFDKVSKTWEAIADKDLQRGWQNYVSTNVPGAGRGFRNVAFGEEDICTMERKEAISDAPISDVRIYMDPKSGITVPIVHFCEAIPGTEQKYVDKVVAAVPTPTPEPTEFAAEARTEEKKPLTITPSTINKVYESGDEFRWLAFVNGFDPDKPYTCSSDHSDILQLAVRQDADKSGCEYVGSLKDVPAGKYDLELIVRQGNLQGKHTYTLEVVAPRPAEYIAVDAGPDEERVSPAASPQPAGKEGEKVVVQIDPRKLREGLFPEQPPVAAAPAEEKPVRYDTNLGELTLTLPPEREYTTGGGFTLEATVTGVKPQQIFLCSVSNFPNDSIVATADMRNKTCVYRGSLEGVASGPYPIELAVEQEGRKDTETYILKVVDAPAEVVAAPAPATPDPSAVPVIQPEAATPAAPVQRQPAQQQAPEGGVAYKKPVIIPAPTAPQPEERGREWYLEAGAFGGTSDISAPAENNLGGGVYVRTGIQLVDNVLLFGELAGGYMPSHSGGEHQVRTVARQPLPCLTEGCQPGDQREIREEQTTSALDTARVLEAYGGIEFVVAETEIGRTSLSGGAGFGVHKRERHAGSGAKEVTIYREGEPIFSRSADNVTLGSNAEGYDGTLLFAGGLRQVLPNNLVLGGDVIYDTRRNTPELRLKIGYQGSGRIEDTGSGEGLSFNTTIDPAGKNFGGDISYTWEFN